MFFWGGGILMSMFYCFCLALLGQVRGRVCDPFSLQHSQKQLVHWAIDNWFRVHQAAD